jgi:DNA-binding NarL/FixJ family response regulator
MSGLDAISSIRQVSPHTRIIIFSNHAQPDYFQKAMSSGAAGYVLKQPEESAYIIQAIKQVAIRGRYIGLSLS